MIDIVFYENLEGKTRRVTFSGHAGYAEPGEDIVCAAVSILFINTVNSLEMYTSDTVIQKTDRKLNYFDISFRDSEISHDADLLLSSLRSGLDMIVEKYGPGFVHVSVKEVHRK